MKEPVDIVDIDPFDPQVVEAVEEQRQVDLASLDSDVKSYIARRKRAYAAVFGNLEDPDVQFVLRDLSVFCRAYRPTFNQNQKLQDLQEGRREVYYRILDYTRQDHDTLYLKLEAARLQPKET